MVEILIVILVVGIIFAMAVPGWIKARNTTRAKTCQETQAQLAGAVSMWAFENNKASDAAGPDYDEIVSLGGILRKTPMCPVGPTVYVIPRVGYPVECPNIDKYPDHLLR